MDDLNKLLILVEKDLKKKMFPRKHVKLLNLPVEIAVEGLPNDTLGRYRTVKDETRKFKNSHKITIAEWQYKRFLECQNHKRWHKQKLKDTIAHELIHAYVYEMYEYESYGFHHDGSPIFLSILSFLNIPSGHKTMRAFKHTENYKKIMEFNSFQALERCLVHESVQWENAFKECDTIMIEDKKRLYYNQLNFSHGDITGLKGASTITLSIEGAIGKANSFIVGSNVDIDEFKQLLVSKADRNLFDKKYTQFTCTNKQEKRQKLKLQSMNI